MEILYDIFSYELTFDEGQIETVKRALGHHLDVGRQETKNGARHVPRGHIEWKDGQNWAGQTSGLPGRSTVQMTFEPWFTGYISTIRRGGTTGSLARKRAAFAWGAVNAQQGIEGKLDGA
jgi:hypothetical protein